MANVKLFGQKYKLPAVVNGRFCRLQRRVNKQYALVQEGLLAKPRWFGIIPMFSASPHPEERFRELDQLIRHYDAIVDELRQSKEAYQLFFAELAAGVQQALADKTEEIRGIEQERRLSYDEAVSQQNQSLSRAALEDEALLLQAVRLLGQIALLLLKKIAICRDGLSRLTDDQERQRQVLTALIDHLNRHRQAFERRRRIDKVVREVAEMAEGALAFEGYMRQHLGPLQHLLDQVVKVDESLHRAVTEIEDITQLMLQQGTLLSSDISAHELTRFDQQMLDFLILGELKKEHVFDLCQRLEQQDGQTEDIPALNLPSADPVCNALDNIQLLVESRLTPLLADGQDVFRVPRGPLKHLRIRTQLHERENADKGPWRSLTATASQLSDYAFGTAQHLNLEFVFIPAGSFQMGSAVFHDEGPIHEVRLSRPFYLGRYPVTQAQWEVVMGSNPSHFRGNTRRPVEHVSWEDVQEFIRRLNEREETKKYRLPTEAEWEYAARADSTTHYGFGDHGKQLGQYAWYEATANGQPHPVGQLKPNAWALYDMHGNVWEWVQDWYDEAYYQVSPKPDPQGPGPARYRVVRGGAWNADAGDCRAASRNVEYPAHLSRLIGFRLLKQL